MPRVTLRGGGGGRPYLRHKRKSAQKQKSPRFGLGGIGTVRRLDRHSRGRARAAHSNTQLISPPRRLHTRGRSAGRAGPARGPSPAFWRRRRSAAIRGPPRLCAHHPAPPPGARAVLPLVSGPFLLFLEENPSVCITARPDSVRSRFNVLASAETSVPDKVTRGRDFYIPFFGGPRCDPKWLPRSGG